MCKAAGRRYQFVGQRTAHLKINYCTATSNGKLSFHFIELVDTWDVTVHYLNQLSGADAQTDFVKAQRTKAAAVKPVSVKPAKAESAKVTKLAKMVIEMTKDPFAPSKPVTNVSYEIS